MERKIKIEMKKMDLEKDRVFGKKRFWIKTTKRARIISNNEKKMIFEQDSEGKFSLVAILISKIKKRSEF